MPTYEYQCRSCAHRFDASQRITASPLTRCPACGERLDRLISGGVGFLFKGSGFYTTDHRSKPYTDAAKKDQAEARGDKVLAATAPSTDGVHATTGPAQNSRQDHNG